MRHRTHAFKDFIRHFVRHSLFVREILAGLLMMLVVCACLVSYIENLPLGQSFYFTFITGLSIGYGEIVPKTGLGQLISVVIGIIGMVFTGITVAVATRSLADTAKEQMQQSSDTL